LRPDRASASNVMGAAMIIPSTDIGVSAATHPGCMSTSGRTKVARKLHHPRAGSWLLHSTPLVDRRCLRMAFPLRIDSRLWPALR